MAYDSGSDSESRLYSEFKQQLIMLDSESASETASETGSTAHLISNIYKKFHEPKQSNFMDQSEESDISDTDTDVESFTNNRINNNSNHDSHAILYDENIVMKKTTAKIARNPLINYKEYLGMNINKGLNKEGYLIKYNYKKTNHSTDIDYYDYGLSDAFKYMNTSNACNLRLVNKTFLDVIYWTYPIKQKKVKDSDVRLHYFKLIKSTMRSFHTINIENLDIRVDDLKYITESGKLRKLNIERCYFDSSWMPYLFHIKSLNISFTNITDDELLLFNRVKKLKIIRMPRITTEGIERFINLENLELKVLKCMVFYKGYFNYFNGNNVPDQYQLTPPMTRELANKIIDRGIIIPHYA